MMKKQNCIYIVLIFIKILQKILKLDTSNYELEKPLPKLKNKKVIGSMKDELGGKNIIKCAGLRAKIYSYLIDDDS